MMLKEKVALVVGSTSGIGEGIAKRFACEGAKVIVTGRRPERGQQVVEAIQANGSQAQYMKLDASDNTDQARVLEAVIGEYGKLDILVNNAGIAPYADLSVDEKTWDSIFDTNLRGAFFMAQKAVPALAKTKGNILFTTSLAGLSAVGAKTGIAYGASKAGLMQVTKIMARLVAKDGIRVNAVSPGLIKTEILDSLPEELLQALISEIPLSRAGTPEDIANTAAFLASDEASFITGQIISVCGGAGDL
jgi:3-oxoacyl-[acyl-carrier protein] reductase